MFMYPINSGDVVWTVGATADLPSSQGFTQQDVAKGEAARHNCLQALAGFMPEVLQLVANTPPGSLVEHGVYIRPASDMAPEAYGRGRVVILGDAAHPLRPTGQGLNTTLEDAYQLAAALMHGGSDIDVEAVQAFRVLQAQRLKPIVKFTTESGEASYR
eukprot:gene7371-7581_t